MTHYKLFFFFYLQGYSFVAPSIIFGENEFSKRFIGNKPSENRPAPGAVDYAALFEVMLELLSIKLNEWESFFLCVKNWSCGWSINITVNRWLQNSYGYPATVFCKISVRRSKNCLEFSIPYQAEEGLKFLDHHFIQVQISKLISQIPYYFLMFIFLHFTP